MDDRRSSERCPVCQGPTKNGENGLRCRKSICSYNHRDVVCPRCGSNDSEVSLNKEGNYHYKCKDCLNGWDAA